MTRTLVAWGPGRGLAPLLLDPRALGERAHAVAATCASLSRGENSGDGIRWLLLPVTRCPGAPRCPFIHPQSAALSTASDRPPGASRELISSVKTVMRGMLLAPASVMLRRAYARPAQRLARRDGGGG
jgi:hypothetical protein